MSMEMLRLLLWLGTLWPVSVSTLYGLYSHPISPLKDNEAEFMQYLIPDLSLGPSLNTCLNERRIDHLTSVGPFHGRCLNFI